MGVRAVVVRAWIVAFAIVAALLVSCASGEEITRSDYGEDWPLTVAQAQLHCNRDAVWVTIEGDDYALNGWAQTLRKLPPLPRSLWRDNPAIPGSKIDVGTLIDDGLALC